MSHSESSILGSVDVSPSNSRKSSTPTVLQNVNKSPPTDSVENSPELSKRSSSNQEIIVSTRELPDNSESASVCGSFGGDWRSKADDKITDGSPEAGCTSNGSDVRDASPESTKSSSRESSEKGTNRALESGDLSPKQGPPKLSSSRASFSSLASSRSMQEESINSRSTSFEIEPPVQVNADRNSIAASNGSDSTNSQSFQRDVKKLSPPLQSSDRHNSDASSVGSSTSKSVKSSDKKRQQRWYQSLYPTYKQRSEEFRKLFPVIPESERLLIDYSCALQRDILVQGRLYVSQNHICFYAKIIAWETAICTPWKSVVGLSKERTARIIPNAISYTTEQEQFYFTSFGQRDKTFTNLYRIWQGAINNQPMSPAEFWSFVHYQYGDDLGLDSDDEDYVQPAYLRSFPEVLVAVSGGDDEEMPMPGGKNVNTLTEDRDNPEPSRSQNHDNSPPTEKSGDSPDGNTLALDSSDSDHADDSTEPVFIPPTPAKGQTLIDHNFQIPFDRLFLVLFSESDLLKEMFIRRKIFETTFGQWSLDATTDCQVRDVKYCMSVGPKTIRTEERQTLLKESVPGRLHLVDSVAQNHGAPYSDSFSVVTHYCIYKLAENSTRLRVATEVVFRKANWAVKAILEKGVMDQLQSRLSNFEAELATGENEERSQNAIPDGASLNRTFNRDVLVSNSSQDNRRMTIRRHRSTSSAPDVIEIEPIEETIFVTRAEYSKAKRLMYLILVLLLVNAVLYWRSWDTFTDDRESASADKSSSEKDWVIHAGRFTNPQSAALFTNINDGLLDILRGMRKINEAVEGLHASLSEVQTHFASDESPS